MKTLLLFGFCALYACTPSANNNNTVSAPVLPLPVDDEDEPTPTPTPTPTDIPLPEDPGKVPEDNLPLKGCNNSNAAGSAHPLAVKWDADSAKYLIDFANEADRQLQIISLYVTAKDDGIPIFPKFEFNGTAYWMVSVDNPFDDFFTFPVVYGKLPNKGVDVTERYKGLPAGGKIATITEATCLKVSVITFEPEEAESFRTSTFLQTHRP